MIWHKKFIYSPLLCLCLLTNYLSSDSGTWTGNTNNDWNNNGNWEGGATYPNGENQTATFQTAANVTINEATELSELIMNSGNNVVLTGAGFANLSIAESIQFSDQAGGVELQLTDLPFEASQINMSAAASAETLFTTTNTTTFSTTDAELIGPGRTFFNATNNFTPPIDSVTLSNNMVMEISNAAQLSDVTSFVVEAGSLIRLPAGSAGGEVSSNISGAGSFVIDNGQTVTLTGANTYSGGTTITNGTLQVSTSTIPATGNITNNSALIFEQNSNGSYARVISGTGTLEKTGEGIVTLTGANTYEGTTTVTQGTLSVTGSLANESDVTVAAGATLTGNGSVGQLTNNGTVAGLQGGETFTVNGGYIQDGAAKLVAYINTTGSSLLDITGTATLNGDLNVNLLSGKTYRAGTAYTVLSAAGGLGGTTFTTHPAQFQIAYQGNNVILTLLNNINALTSTWTGAGGDNDWSTADNWDIGVVPNSVDAIAVFPINASPTLSEEITLQKVILQNNSQVDVTAENFAFSFSTPKKQTSVQGGTFQVSGAAGMVLNDGAQMTLLGNAGELIGLANLSGGGETNTLRFFKSKQKSLGSGDTLFNLNTVTNLNAAITNNGGCQLLLNGTNSFDQTFTNTGRAIVATLQGSDNIFNDAVTNTKGGTFQTLGNATNTFAVGGTFTNGRKSIFQSLDTSDNVFTAAVTNSGTMQLSGDSTNNFEAGGTLRNNKKSVVQCYGTSTNRFDDAITNAGTIQCLESSTNSFTTVANSGTMRFYGSVGAVGSTNTFAEEVTNTGNLLFYGIDDIAGEGHSINNFNAGALIINTGKRTVQFFENSVNTFKVEQATAISNEGKGKVLFYGNSINTFGDAVTGYSDCESVGSGSIQFYGNSVNSFDNFSYAASDGTGSIQFYGNSVNSFTSIDPGAKSAAFNNGLGSIRFYGNSVNNFNLSQAFNDGAGTLQFYGNSVNTFENNSEAVNEGTGLIRFYGNSVNNFDATSSFNSSGNGSIYFYDNTINTFTAGAGEIIFDHGTIAFFGNSTTTFSKNITSNDQDENKSFRVYGNASVNLNSAGNSNFDGSLQVYQNGTLAVNTVILNAETLVGNANKKLRGGTLTGNGQLKNVTLVRNGRGTIKPTAGESLTITGNFTQNNGTVSIHIGPAALESSLAVAGNVSLGGPLFLEIDGGGYAAGDFDIITYGGELTGTFSKVTASNGVVAVADYETEGTVKVNVPAEVATILFPTAANKLDKNKQAIAKHLVKAAPLMYHNKDAQRMVNALARQPAKKFKQDLMRLAPIAHTVSAQRGLQNTAKLAEVLDHQFLAEKNVYQSQQKDKTSSTLSLTDLLSFQTPQTGFFIDTLGHVEQTTSFESPFSVQTKGANFGWNKIYRGQFVFEGGLSCTTSELKSQDGMGHLAWSSLSFAPMLGWFNENAYANVTLLSGVSFYNQSREIAYADIDRHASSQYHSLDLLAKLGSGYCLDLGNHLSLQADAGLNVQALYTSSYQERGAESLNLSVKGRREVHLEPNLKVQGSKVFLGNQISYTPTFYLSWSKDQRLDSGALCARFDFAQKGEYFEIQEASKRNQKLVVGTDFTMKRLGQFELSANVEADMMSHFEDYSMKAKLQWVF